jgi:para-nitrobenzyl esterase
MEITVGTGEGRLGGIEENGVRRFLGIPYAAAPVGAGRLRSPRPHPGWTGIRPALEIGPAAPQKLAGMQTWLNDPIARFDEDCLYLNVYTPAEASAAPVMVWFHGGATRAGHGGAATISGARLAREQGIVVVTVNYRLGPLGGLAHPELADEDTGHVANWGMQDKIAALQWVQRSIGAFGGDPGAVTIAGQSSGGTNAILIAQNPDCAGLFHRVIAMSPPLFRPPMFVGLDAAAEYTAALADLLGVPVRGLRDMDGATLVRRELEFLNQSEFAQRFGRPRTAPTLDGLLVREWAYTGTAAPVPLIIGFTRDEARFWYDLKLPDGTVLTTLKPPSTLAELKSELARLVKLYYAFDAPPAADEVIAAYGGGAASDGDAARLWFEAYADLLFRAPILHYAARHAARAPAYLYESAWPLAVPAEGTPHAADVPFLFGTVANPHIAAKIGYGPEAEAASAVTMAMFGGFVRTGAPAAVTGLPAWRPLAGVGDVEAMTFGASRRPASFGALDRPPPPGFWRAFDPPG